jgi:hypothetical protein
MITLPQILEKFGFGHLNPLAETKTIDVDQRRSTSISSMNKALQVYYDKNCLINQNEYYGIVVGIVERSVQSYANKNSWGQREGMSAGDSSPYQIYRVYIPELECRPAPVSLDDPVIATYSEIPVAFDLPMSVSKGAIVKVAYGDPLNMAQPEIVSVEGGIDGAALPVFGSSLAGSFNGGSAKGLPATAGKRGVVLGDSLSQLPVSFGGLVGAHLEEMGMIIRPAMKRDEGAGGYRLEKGGPKYMPPGVWSYPGKNVPWFLKNNKLKKILDKERAQLLVVLLGTNSAYGALPQGAMALRRSCRGKALAYGIDDAKTKKACSKSGPLAPREAKYKAQLKEFIKIARGSGVERIIWFGPPYASGIYGNKPFSKRTWRRLQKNVDQLLDEENITEDEVVLIQRKMEDGESWDWGKSGLETGAENIRKWQAEVLIPLGVEWIDTKPLTENLRPGDGLHFRPDTYTAGGKAMIEAAFG